MLNTSNLSQKEKIYLTELVKAALYPNLSITEKTISSLKLGVLEAAFSTLESKLPDNKKMLIKKIMSKIVYPSVQEAVLLIPKENRLKDKEI